MTNRSLLLIVGGLILITTGCSQDPSSPVSSSSMSSITAPAPRMTQGVTSSLVGPSGGTVMGDGATLFVPAGALSQAVAISIETVVVNGRGMHLLSPVGLPLAGGADLLLQKPAGFAIGTVYHVFEQNPGSGLWVDLGGVSEGGWVRARVDVLGLVDGTGGENE